MTRSVGVAERMPRYHRESEPFARRTQDTVANVARIDWSSRPGDEYKAFGFGLLATAPMRKQGFLYLIWHRDSSLASLSLRGSESPLTVGAPDVNYLVQKVPQQ